MPILKVIIKINHDFFSSRFIDDTPGTSYAYVEGRTWEDVKRIAKVNGVMQADSINWGNVQAFHKDIGTPTQRFVYPVFPPFSVRGVVATKQDYVTGWLTSFSVDDMREPLQAETSTKMAERSNDYARKVRRTEAYERLAQKITDNLYDGVDVLREHTLDQVKGIVLATLVKEGE